MNCTRKALSKLEAFFFVKFSLFIAFLHASSLPVFKDVTEEAGITFKHSFGDFELSNIVEGTGAGATWFDYDGDGDLDLYLVCGCWHPEVSDNRGRRLRGKLKNVLYRNNGDGTFTDVTDVAGVGDKGFGFSASAADYDGDGDLDLYVCNCLLYTSPSPRD